MKKVVFLLVMTIFGTSLFAQETEKEARVKNPSDAMVAVSLAVDLATYGYTTKSALSLIESARILIANPVQALTVAKSEPSKGSDGSKTDKFPSFTADQLLKDAKTYANGDKTILELIAKMELQASKNRGRVYGPAYAERRVYGNSSYTDFILFKGQEFAEVALIGDGDTDLDLYVYDENGNFIGSDTDYSDRCYVSFTPKWQGSFKIVVKNRGNIYNDYVLVSN
jgi:hypothetical protein